MHGTLFLRRMAFNLQKNPVMLLTGVFGEPAHELPGQHEKSSSYLVP
jgi:hypothetical protein